MADRLYPNLELELDSDSGEFAAVFAGEFRLKLSSKQRLILPKDFREQIYLRNDGPKQYVQLLPAVRNGEPFIACYDAWGWKRKYPNLKKVLKGAETNRREIREQGRMVMPRWLCVYARLVPGEEVVIAASPEFTYIEMWNEEAYRNGYGEKISSRLEKLINRE